MLPLKAEETPDYLRHSKKCNHGEKELVRQVGAGRRSREGDPRRAVFRLHQQQLGCAEQAAHRHIRRSQLLRMNEKWTACQAVHFFVDDSGLVGARAGDDGAGTLAFLRKQSARCAAGSPL